MPRAVIWTPEADALILRMRVERASWDKIGACLGLSHWTIVERGRVINAELGPAPEPEIIIARPDRDPLPAGHPTSWGAIAREPYPYPVFR